MYVKKVIIVSIVLGVVNRWVPGFGGLVHVYGVGVFYWSVFANNLMGSFVGERKL